MSAHSNAAPVIIKRKKVIAGGGHHGGAWKVAYADFVTAMMAFFLLMWLLSATTEKQRKGVADYFSPTIPINRVSGGGDGAFGGESVFSELTLPQNGMGASNLRPTEAQQARGENGASKDDADGHSHDRQAETAAFEALEVALRSFSGESNAAKSRLRHIITRVTDEGMIIEIFDLDEVAMFDPETDTPTRALKDLANMLVRILPLVENNLAIGGHTRAKPIVLANNPVWDLSTARAHAMRRLLQTTGLDGRRVQRVTGHADKSPAVRNPMAVRNNRLEITLLRSSF